MHSPYSTKQIQFLLTMITDQIISIWLSLYANCVCIFVCLLCHKPDIHLMHMHIFQHGPTYFRTKKKRGEIQCVLILVCFIVSFGLAYEYVILISKHLNGFFSCWPLLSFNFSEKPLRLSHQKRSNEPLLIKIDCFLLLLLLLRSI